MAARFEIERVGGVPVSTDDLLDDLRKCGELQADGVLTQARYVSIGKYAATTMKDRFGSWNKAVAAAGFQTGNTWNVTDEELFANLLRVWEHRGRQPRRSEMMLPPSSLSHHPYVRRFQSWTAALHEFAAFANSSELAPVINEEKTAANKSSRSASLRLRFQVLKRDDFRCQTCGKSPAAFPGLHLHVDHILPWSRGGETTLENLRTLCEPCNLGKSNIL